MANNERVAKLLLRIQTDRAAVQRTQRELESLVADVRQFSAVEQEVAVNGRKTVQSLDQQAQAARRTQNEVRGLLKAYQDAKTASSAGATDSRPFMGGRGSTLAMLGTELRALPAVGTPLGVSTDVFAKVLNIFGRLPPVFTAAAGAGAVLVGVIAAIQANAQQAEEAIRKQIQAEQEIRKVIADATTAEVKAKAEEAQKNVEFYQSEIKRLQDMRAAELARQGIEGELTPQERLAQGLGLAFGELTGIDKEIQAATENANKYGIELNSLNTALLNNTAATNDAKKAEEELTKARAANARANIDRLISAQQEAAQLAATGTSESLKQRLDSLAIEKKAILDNLQAAQELAKQTGDNSQVDKLRARLNDIDTLTNTILFGGVADIIRAREDEAKRIEDLKKQQEEYLKAAEAASKAQADYNAKLEDIAATVRDKLADALKDRDKALADAAADAAKERAKAETEVQEQLAEAAQKANEDRQEAERDHLQKLAEIDKQFQRDFQQATEDRDAVAAARAQQARDDAVSDENKSYDERLRDIDRALEKGNQQINKRYNEQIRAVDERLAEQTRRAVERYNEQVAAAIAYGNEQRRLAYQQMQQNLKALNDSLSGELNLKNAGYKAMMQGAQVYSDWLVAEAAKIKAAASGNTNSAAGQGNTTATPFAQGISRGLTPAFRDFMVGERGPEIMRLPTRTGVFTPQQYMRAGGSTVNVMPGGVQINGSNLNAFQLEKAVTAGLARFVKAMQ